MLEIFCDVVIFVVGVVCVVMLFVIVSRVNEYDSVNVRCLVEDMGFFFL